MKEFQKGIEFHPKSFALLQKMWRESGLSYPKLVGAALLSWSKLGAAERDQKFREFIEWLDAPASPAELGSPARIQQEVAQELAKSREARPPVVLRKAR